MTTPVKAAFERSAQRFANAHGISEEDQMATAKAPVNTKTAAGANAENDFKGSQVQTTQDRGDYGSQSEEVGKQKTETSGAAPEGTAQAGNQNQSVKYDDKNYTLTGGAARLATVKTVAAIAGVDPSAAAKFIHMAEGAGDVGTPMGGEPDAVKEGDAAAEGGDAVPTEPAAPTVTPDQAATVKLTDIIRQSEQEMEIGKAVNDKLKEVAKEIGAKIKLPYLGVGTITAWHKDGFSAKFASVDANIRFSTKTATWICPDCGQASSCVDDKGNRRNCTMCGEGSKSYGSRASKQAAGTMPLAAPAPSVPSSPTSVQTRAPGKTAPKQDVQTTKPAQLEQAKAEEQITDKTLASLKGRKVKHPQFGMGIVTAVKGPKIAIAFANDITVMLPKSALERSDEDGKTKQDEMGNGKVPHTAVDVQDKPQGDGDPDWTLYDQSRESQATNETDTNNGQQVSDSADRDYKLARNRIASGYDFDRDQKEMLMQRQHKQGKHNSPVDGCPLCADGKLAKAQDHLRKQVEALVVKGMDIKEATKRVAATRLGQAVIAAVKRKKAIEAKRVESARRKRAADDATGRTVGGNTPPDEMKSDQADDTTRYDSKEQGDTGDDSISAGTDTLFESPETAGVVNDARGNLDKKHNDDTKGSTVAMFSSEERKKALAHLKRMDQIHDGMKELFAKVSPVIVTHQGKGAVIAVVKETIADLKGQGDIIEASLKTASGDRRAVRTKLADAVVAGRTLMKSAKQQAALLGVLAKEATLHRNRFARVSPAFKLAAVQLQAGLISGPDEMAKKVAEYINLDKTSFEVLAKNVNETIHKVASRPQQRKTASRLPFVGTDGPVGQSQSRDELDGIFDD